jgi:hypothetical protein
VTALSLLEATNGGLKKLDEDGSGGWLSSSHLITLSLMMCLCCRIDVDGAVDFADTIRPQASGIIR